MLDFSYRSALISLAADTTAKRNTLWEQWTVFSHCSTLDFTGIMVQWSGNRAVKKGEGEATEGDRKNGKKKKKNRGPGQQEIQSPDYHCSTNRPPLWHTERGILCSGNCSGLETGAFREPRGWLFYHSEGAEVGSLTLEMDSLTPFKLPRSFTMCSSVFLS